MLKLETERIMDKLGYKCVPGVLIIILMIISDNLADVNFKSKATTVKTFENESCLLPCNSKVEHQGVRWYDLDGILLIDSDNMDTKANGRMTLYPNGSLEVINLQLEDTGDYICEVQIGNKVIKQLHGIEVQFAPTVISLPTGVIERPLGSIFEIVCEPKGVPYPLIQWQHNGVNVTNTYDNKRHYLVDIQSYDYAGKIECIANNGVGEPAVTGITLIVLFAPDIIVHVAVIHTTINVKVQLECIVYSSPLAQVHWFFEGRPVMKDNRIVFQETDVITNETSFSDARYYSRKRHCLVIKSVRDSDLGQYECKAENRMGIKNGMIQLTGKPMRSTFRRDQLNTPTSQMLVWQTESPSPIIEFKLKFRQVMTGNIVHQQHQRNALWNEFSIPADTDSSGPFQTKAYNMQGLQPATVYEIIVQSRNRYGWSDVSRILKFATPSEIEIISSTESIEYNELDYNENKELFLSHRSSAITLTAANLSILLINLLTVIIMK